MSERGDLVAARGREGTLTLTTATFPSSLHASGVVVDGVLPYGSYALTLRASDGRVILRQSITLPTACEETAGSLRAA